MYTHVRDVQSHTHGHTQLPGQGQVCCHGSQRSCSRSLSFPHACSALSSPPTSSFLKGRSQSPAPVTKPQVLHRNSHYSDHHRSIPGPGWQTNSVPSLTAKAQARTVSNSCILCPDLFCLTQSQPWGGNAPPPGLTSYLTHPGHLSAPLTFFEPQCLCTAISMAQSTFPLHLYPHLDNSCSSFKLKLKYHALREASPD